MKPGRALDKLVAEKVFGKTVRELELEKPRFLGDKLMEVDDTTFKQLPHYSTDIAAAWLVIEKFPDYQLDRFGGKHRATFESETHSLYEGESHTAPHAICIAALRALGVDLETLSDP